MDIWESQRELVAEITSALRAVGLEPISVGAHQHGASASVLEAFTGQISVTRGGVTASVGESKMEHPSIADAAAWVAEGFRIGAVAWPSGSVWQARRAKWGSPLVAGATREEALALALAS